MGKTSYKIKKFDCFDVYEIDDSSQFFHIDINNLSIFYKKLFDYFFSEDNLLRYAKNISAIQFDSSKKHFAILFKQLKVFIDQKNLELSTNDLDSYLKSLLMDDGVLKDKDGKTGVLLDKIGKMGEYIFCCILSDYFNFNCIIPKAHLLTDYNMSVYGIDVLYYSESEDLLLFGESKVSKTISNGVNLINKSLKEYEKQLKDEFTLVLSSRILENSNVFTKKYGAIAEESVSIEDFIKKAEIKHIGIPIFIAHGTELKPNIIFGKLGKINKQRFFDLDTRYYLITLPIINKETFAKEFTKYIRNRIEEYEKAVQ